MSSSGITRSVNGCLTCKNRKKKCDETRPICMRCSNGDFKCLGYDHLSIPKGPRGRKKKQVTPTSLSPLLDPQDGSSSPSSTIVSFVQISNMIQAPQVNRWDPDHIVQMFLFYSEQRPRGVQPFRSFPFSINQAIAQNAKRSSLSLKSTYVGAQIRKAVLDGTGLSVGVRLIVDFQQQITNITLSLDTNPVDVATLLGCWYSLVHAALHIINTPASYSLLRKSVPLFLTLAAESQDLWTEDSSISAQLALTQSRFEIRHFVFHDTLMSLVLGVVPLVHYDTTLSPRVQPVESPYIEWAHGCSIIVLTLLARINFWRAARLLDPTYPTPTPEQEEEFLACLQEWKTPIEYGDEATVVMGRLAVQETWKHAVLIYLYMGMCEADSADPRVEASVRQVAQLSATIESDHPLEAHITVPCIIAAAAARKEKHRAILRKKISISRNERVCLVRGADFLPVLDHLWHGAAVGGFPTTWQDYVDSRFEMLPVEI